MSSLIQIYIKNKKLQAKTLRKHVPTIESLIPYLSREQYISRPFNMLLDTSSNATSFEEIIMAAMKSVKIYGIVYEFTFMLMNVKMLCYYCRFLFYY